MCRVCKAPSNEEVKNCLGGECTISREELRTHSISHHVESTGTLRVNNIFALSSAFSLLYSKGLNQLDTRSAGNYPSPNYSINSCPRFYPGAHCCHFIFAHFTEVILQLFQNFFLCFQTFVLSVVQRHVKQSRGLTTSARPLARFTPEDALVKTH